MCRHVFLRGSHGQGRVRSSRDITVAFGPSRTKGRPARRSRFPFHVIRFQREYRVKTKSRSLAGVWHAKHVLTTASPSGLPSVNCETPQPPVDAYFFESFTMN